MPIYFIIFPDSYTYECPAELDGFFGIEMNEHGQNLTCRYMSFIDRSVADLGKSFSAFCTTFQHCKFTNPHCTFVLVKSSIHYYLDFQLSPHYRTAHLITALHIPLPNCSSHYRTAHPITALQTQLNLSKFFDEKGLKQDLNPQSLSFKHCALTN